MTDIAIVVPEQNARENFDRQVAALREMLNNLLDRNANLRRTRDLLLPKLVSGEVDVDKLQVILKEQ